MFRIPSFAEIGALFLKNHTVSQAVAGITAAVKRLEDVVAHHSAQSVKKGNEATELSKKASALLNEAAAHDAEAAQAARVSANLTKLVA